jgi:hypothetical protein
MGKYDGMTSPKVAEKYLNSLVGTGVREMLLFEQDYYQYILLYIDTEGMGVTFSAKK